MVTVSLTGSAVPTSLVHGVMLEVWTTTTSSDVQRVWPGRTPAKKTAGPIRVEVLVFWGDRKKPYAQEMLTFSEAGAFLCVDVFFVEPISSHHHNDAAGYCVRRRSSATVPMNKHGVVLPL